MKKLFIIIFSLSAVSVLSAQSGKEKLNTQLSKLKNDPALKHSAFAFCVMNAKTGAIAAEYNSELSLVPASTLKTLTTGAALGILGKNFRYETVLGFTGEFNSASGEISGNLVIKGSGDPTLGSQYFKKKEDSLDVIDEFVQAVKKKGIKKINGKIIADNSCFDTDIPGTWIWSDIGNYYGAPPNGISYRDNKYSLYFKSGQTGTQTEITKKIPADIDLQFENHVTACGTDDNAFIYGSPGEKTRIIKGSIPASQTNYEVEGSMPDPALYFAQKLKEALLKNNIAVSGSCIVQEEQNKINLLFTHKSPTLDKIVYYTNMKSNNHYAETLLKTLAWKKCGLGTTAAGTDIAAEYWKAKGVSIEGLFMSDGSGLSRSNAVTPFTQAKVLSKIYSDSLMYGAFNSSLPVSGVSGGMIGIGKGTAAEGNMRAKSGYITRARAYCGYVKNTAGEELSFSIIFNNYSCSPKEVKGKMESLMILFTGL